MPGKIFRQKGDEAAAYGHRLIAFLRPLGPKKRRGSLPSSANGSKRLVSYFWASLSGM